MQAAPAIPPMRLLLNPAAGSPETDDPVRAAAAERGVPVVDVADPGAFAAAVEAAAREGEDVVVAAGGDGTACALATALVGLADADLRLPADRRPAFGILPTGTGNDFARTLALPLGDPAAALDVLLAGDARPVDVIRATWDGGSAISLNVCNGGFGGTLADTMDAALKATLGPLAYLVGAAKTLAELVPYRVRIACDDAPEETIDAYNVVVANGRTAGGGAPVAPAADPGDGLLDVVVVRAGGTLDLARLALGTLTGDHLADDDLLWVRAARVTIRATPAMPFNVDGDPAAEAGDATPVTFEALPGALRALVGPDYVASPELPPFASEGA